MRLLHLFPDLWIRINVGCSYANVRAAAAFSALEMHAHPFIIDTSAAQHRAMIANGQNEKRLMYKWKRKGGGRHSRIKWAFVLIGSVMKEACIPFEADDHECSAAELGRRTRSTQDDWPGSSADNPGQVHCMQLVACCAGLARTGMLCAIGLRQRSSHESLPENLWYSYKLGARLSCAVGRDLAVKPRRWTAGLCEE